MAPTIAELKRYFTKYKKGMSIHFCLLPNDIMYLK